MSVLSAPQQAQLENQVAGLIENQLGHPKCSSATTTDCVAGFEHHEPPAPRDCAASRRWSVVDRICRRLVRGKVDAAGRGQIDLVDGLSTASRPSQAAIYIHDPTFYRRAVLSGSLGAAEAYLRGEWSSGNLVVLMQALAREMDALGQVDRGFAWLLRPLRSALNWLRRNNRIGSRRNIAAHYDLSNDFFSLMLDPTMTYSSGIFEHPSATMQEASLAKYDRICRKLELSGNDHVLEIGTGWGGFAIYAAQNFGCRVTTTTISQPQHDFARERIRQAKLSERITLVMDDYRDLAGTFDKLVSIEMIEAVGEHFLMDYFGQCSQLLKPHGMMLLQAITIPDHRYDSYRRSVDFIQRYIFPGGFLPSFSAICDSLRRRTDFRLFHSEDFGPDYAETLSRWRRQFWTNIDRVRQLGFDERFIRMWHYYLCYCEAGFRERQIGVSQLLLTKPMCRRARVCDRDLSRTEITRDARPESELGGQAGTTRRPDGC